MTNNDDFKKDATELLNKVLSFKRKYLGSVGKGAEVNASLFEKDIRMMLHIARNDEENKEQYQQDCYC